MQNSGPWDLCLPVMENSRLFAQARAQRTVRPLQSSLRDGCKPVSKNASGQRIQMQRTRRMADTSRGRRPYLHKSGWFKSGGLGVAIEAEGGPRLLLPGARKSGGGGGVGACAPPRTVSFTALLCAGPIDLLTAQAPVVGPNRRSSLMGRGR